MQDLFQCVIALLPFCKLWSRCRQTANGKFVDMMQEERQVLVFMDVLYRTQRSLIQERWRRMCNPFSDWFSPQYIDPGENGFLYIRYSIFQCTSMNKPGSWLEKRSHKLNASDETQWAWEPTHTRRRSFRKSFLCIKQLPIFAKAS